MVLIHRTNNSCWFCRDNNIDNNNKNDNNDNNNNNYNNNNNNKIPNPRLGLQHSCIVGIIIQTVTFTLALRSKSIK